MSQLRLYPDEDAMRRSLVFGLRARNVDVVTALEREMINRSDEDHLAAAAESEAAKPHHNNWQNAAGFGVWWRRNRNQPESIDSNATSAGFYRADWLWKTLAHYLAQGQNRRVFEVARTKNQSLSGKVGKSG